MREIINLHLGQAGVQLGNATWELLCIEHGINQDGYMDQEPEKMENLETFFTITSSQKFIPKTVFIDLEPTVIDEIRNGSYRNLFHPNRLITGMEDAANNFARGFFTIGKLIIEKVNKEIRKTIEACDYIHAIMIFRSLGGGTGSGLTSAIFDFLAEYPKTHKLEIPIYPSSSLQSSTVEPYNSLLAQHFGMEEVDVGMLIENQALYNICSKNLKQVHLTFSAINRIVAQICSNMTASLRFENTITSDLSILQNNIVPYPRIHFPLCSFSPIVPECIKNHETFSVTDITRSVFKNDNQLVEIDNSLGKIMSCSLNYRGNVSPTDVYKALSEIKQNNNIQFVDWCPTGFKVGINVCIPSVVPFSGLSQAPRNVILLTNTSAIGKAWEKLTKKFYNLYLKKSFVHWFVGEGMEECEFTESLNNIGSLVKDYEEIVIETKEKNISNKYQNETNQFNQTKPTEKIKENPKKKDMKAFKKLIETKKQNKIENDKMKNQKINHWGSREEKLFEIIRKSFQIQEYNINNKKTIKTNNKNLKIKSQKIIGKSEIKINSKNECKVR